MRRFRLLALMCAFTALVCLDCGTAITTQFPNRLVGADGQLIVLEDVEEALGAGGTAEEKRSRLRDLGIEDEKLIDALLAS